MPIDICKLEHYQSFASTLKPLNSALVHFKDGISVTMLNTSADVWVGVKYVTDITHEGSYPVDVNSLTIVKGDVVDVKLDGNVILLKPGKLTHKAPILADPSIEKKNKSEFKVVWPHSIVDLTAEDMKDISSMIDNKSKYDFTISNNTFSIKDMTDGDVQFDIPYECGDKVISRFHGVNLDDTIISAKHFNGCQLLLGNDTPLSLQYTNEWLTVNYILAPMNRAVDD
jgi:hypothetical protein